MTEIYWITRLGHIHTLCTLLGVFGCVLFIVSFLGNLICSLYKEQDEDLSHAKHVWEKLVVPTAIIGIFGILGLVFVPSRKDALAIYGVGTTIDYIKSNDNAKQLPDKAIDALARYLDSIEEDKKE